MKELKSTISIILDDLFTHNVISIGCSAHEEHMIVQQIRIHPSCIMGHPSLWHASAATHEPWFTLHEYGVTSLMTLLHVIRTTKRSSVN